MLGMLPHFLLAMMMVLLLPLQYLSFWGFSTSVCPVLINFTIATLLMLTVLYHYQPYSYLHHSEQKVCHLQDI